MHHLAPSGHQSLSNIRTGQLSYPFADATLQSLNPIMGTANTLPNIAVPASEQTIILPNMGDGAPPIYRTPPTDFGEYQVLLSDREQDISGASFYNQDNGPIPQQWLYNDCQPNVYPDNQDMQQYYPGDNGDVDFG